MSIIHALTPLVRYLLLTLATWLVATGIVPQEVGDEIARNDAIFQAVMGVILWVLTWVWYFLSTSRKALKTSLAD